jgi:hypothetical protein
MLCTYALTYAQCQASMMCYDVKASTHILNVVDVADCVDVVGVLAWKQIGCMLLLCNK